MIRADDIPPRIHAMNEALMDKGYVAPDCDINITGSGDITVWIKTRSQDEIPGKMDWEEASDIESALDKADRRIDGYDDAHLYKKQAAVKQFGRAIDGLRSAGFEAEFCDPLSEQMQAMTENLLTHQPEATS
jgi:hypothetical protein